MGERDRPPCSSATGPAGCGGGAALRVARHGAAWLFKRDLPPGSRSSPPPFRLLRTCSLSGGRRGSSPARWGSPPADGREGRRESAGAVGLEAGSRHRHRHRAEAGSVSTQPRPLLPRLCGGDPARGQTAGAGGAAGDAAPPRCTPGAPQAAGPELWGRSTHTRDPEPGKEPGTGVRGERSLSVGHGRFGKGGAPTASWVVDAHPQRNLIQGSLGHTVGLQDS